jgi:hypothetical protein
MLENEGIFRLCELASVEGCDGAIFTLPGTLFAQVL